MIDYFKVIIEGISIEQLMNNSNFDFFAALNIKTGEIKQNTNRYRQFTGHNDLIALYRSLTITIIDDRLVKVEGSLHQFAKNGKNFDDFTYLQIVYSLKEISAIFNHPLEKFKLQNLEFGVNLEVTQSVSDILNQIHSYKGTKRGSRHYKNGEMCSFNLSQYSIKLYDKGRQHNLENQLIRIELKARKMQFLNRKHLKIHTLNDLIDVTVLKELGNILYEYISRLVIVDSNFPQGVISLNEKKFMEIVNTNNYWQKLFIEKQVSYRKQLSKLNKITEMFGELSIRQVLLLSVNNKWNELLKGEIHLKPMTSKGNIISHSLQQNFDEILQIELILDDCQNKFKKLERENLNKYVQSIKCNSADFCIRVYKNEYGNYHLNSGAETFPLKDSTRNVQTPSYVTDCTSSMNDLIKSSQILKETIIATSNSLLKTGYIDNQVKLDSS